ncbi:MAG: ribonuclease Z [Nanoarchaeota archaeon]|nr:ribonuclease Z [Nanoarchaeota archaeon]
MKVVFLGTSGMVPTKERNVQGIYLDYNGEGILLDCGEGTQRQIQHAGLNAQKIKKILISHWHGDHVSGLLGLLQTIGNFSGDDKTIKLFGPVGSKQYLEHLTKSCVFDVQLNLEVIELNPTGLETFFENEDYALQAILLDHSVPCLGFKFLRKERRKMNQAALQEKGVQGELVGQLQSGKSVEVKGISISPEEVSVIEPSRSVSFIFDTRICDACYTLAQDSDLLVSEAVYKDDLQDKAQEYGHMTALQVAQVASQSGVEQLILTHFSQRYKDVGELEEEAKSLFENTSCAYDLMKVNLPF